MNFSIADKLTVFRIIIVPFIVLFFSLDTGKSGITGDYFKILAAFLFILGAISDGMDGYYARKYNTVSNFGKLLDPVSDKILVSSTLIVLTSYGYVPAYVSIIIIAREFLITGLRLVAMENKNVIGASKLGKWKTTFQLTYIITLLVFISFDVIFKTYSFKSDLINLYFYYKYYIIKLLEILAVFYTVYSGYDYYSKNLRVME